MSVEAYPGCRFYVLFDDRAQGVFTEISGLQVEMDMMEYQEGGNNGFVYRLPGFTKVSNLTLKRGLAESNEFYTWLADVSGGKLKRRHVTVVMYDASGTKLRSWNFINAYPVKWVGPQLRASDNTAAIETLELAHEGMTVE
ncbi:MAG TPA: phage tail protein [Ktedonobacteraceae bacterium]|nr:phage tail protein [Ktedonobacteraceae bacterium]